MLERIAQTPYFLHGGVLPYLVAAIAGPALAVAVYHAVRPHWATLMLLLATDVLLGWLGWNGYKAAMQVVAHAVSRVPERLQPRLETNGYAEAKWQLIVAFSLIASVLVLVVIGEVRRARASRAAAPR